MARFYSNENLALQVVAELRRLGQDVIPSLDAGNANSAVPDAEVLAFAQSMSAIAKPALQQRDYPLGESDRPRADYSH